MSCTQNREESQNHQNPELPARAPCLWPLPPCLKPTHHTRLRNRVVSPMSWMCGVLLQRPLGLPCPGLWVAMIETDKHWTWSPKTGLYSQCHGLPRGEGIQIHLVFRFILNLCEQHTPNCLHPAYSPLHLPPWRPLHHLTCHMPQRRGAPVSLSEKWE